MSKLLKYAEYDDWLIFQLAEDDMQYFDLPDLMQLYRSGGVRSPEVAEVGDKYQIR